jgi:hypothetical protein
MSIKNKYSVKSIDNYLCKDWLLHKHYAKRIPSISYAFGLFSASNILNGIVCYGRPVAHTLIKNAFSGEYQEQFLELNRLVVNEGLEKNTLSFFVSESLKMLPKPQVIVSYADTSQNHNGYIYQATNWFYTGLSAEFKDYMVKGLEHMHSASIMDKVGRSDGDNGHINKVELLKMKFGEENIYMVDRPRKHRYFYFLGNKNEVKKMKQLLKYKQEPYPKGENKRYDASFKPTIQTQLF